MTIYIVVVEEKGSKNAIAAFSSDSQMKDYIRDEAIEDPKFDFYETADESTEVPSLVYAAHKKANADAPITQLAGYFSNKYDSLVAAGKFGFVNVLNVDLQEIDEPEEESAPVANENTESPKPTAPRKAHRTIYADTREAIVKSQSGNSKQWVLLAVLIILFGIATYVAQQFEYRLEFAENVESVDWLPDQCSEISYFLSERIDVYEFNTSKQVFVDWAKEQQLKISPIIEEEEYSIKTYRSYADIDMSEIHSLPESQQWERWKELSTPTIKKGLKLVGKPEDKSFTSLGAYNEETGRAYYWVKRKKES